ncbi:MAG: hypothetical protein J6B41_07785 [Alistipes sp.]|nr:hypothetical protein [Alistipes sp.]
MKKLICITMLLFGFVGIASAQNVVIQTNNTDSKSSTTQTTGNEYFINGISTAQDIGGVDAEIINTGKWDSYYCDYYHKIKFTNYHEFTVTVLFEIGISKVPGTITIPAKTAKTAPNEYLIGKDDRRIVMIVRKL